MLPASEENYAFHRGKHSLNTCNANQFHLPSHLQIYYCANVILNVRRFHTSCLRRVFFCSICLKCSFSIIVCIMTMMMMTMQNYFLLDVIYCWLIEWGAWWNKFAVKWGWNHLYSIKHRFMIQWWEMDCAFPNFPHQCFVLRGSQQGTNEGNKGHAIFYD